MKQRLLTLTLAAALAASFAVADAGQRHGGSSSGSSGSSSGSSGGGSTSSSGGGSSSSGGGGGSHVSSPPSRGSGGGGAVPRHGGADSGGRSAGRGSGGGSSSSTAGRSGDGGSTAGGGAVRRHPESSASGPDRASEGVPDYSRPRSGRPVAGYAVPRGNVVPPGRPGGDYPCCFISPYRWYYNPWAFGTWGLGYMYDPFWWGYGGPYAGAYGYGGGYGGYGYGYGGGGGGGQDDYQGALRIKVKPREAKVRVDGYVVGTVDDFDGNFQKLRLDDGPHKVELLLDGYSPLLFDVMIVEGQTVTYKGKMTPR